jgi:hypothetical protein
MVRELTTFPPSGRPAGQGARHPSKSAEQLGVIGL